MASQVLHLDRSTDARAALGDAGPRAFSFEQYDPAAITKAAREIASAAAWLTWQIDAHDLMLHEASYQLDVLSETLSRHAGRLPEDERRGPYRLLAEARTAAERHDLDGVAQSIRQLRADMDRLRLALNERA